MHLEAVGKRCLISWGQRPPARRQAVVLRPGQHEARQYRHLARAAADTEEAADEPIKMDSGEDYQLRRDFKSVARTVLEGKPLLQEDRTAVDEEEGKERFFGRLAVLSLGVRHCSQSSSLYECNCSQTASKQPPLGSAARRL